MADRKRLPWRCRNEQQAKDKAAIYNSHEWRELRALKLRQQPLCEQCLADGRAAGVAGGYVRSATCVHHIVPIETATTPQEMRRLALCGVEGLMSLCRECHDRIHNQQGYHSTEAVRERAQSRLERWRNGLAARFAPPKNDDGKS